MTEQLPMFPQDLYEAIRDTVRALGGPKRVGHELQPDLDPEAAGRWLSDCCNPDRREKLSPTQLAYIRRRARQAGVHILAEFEARDAGYAPPTPIEPESERAALMREFNRQMEAFVALSRRLESLGAIPPEANDA
jgi:hypothetical protein